MGACPCGRLLNQTLTPRVERDRRWPRLTRAPVRASAAQCPTMCTATLLLPLPPSADTETIPLTFDAEEAPMA